MKVSGSNFERVKVCGKSLLPVVGQTYTNCFTELGKLNLLIVVQIRLKPIYTAAPAASKNVAQIKRGQN